MAFEPGPHHSSGSKDGHPDSAHAERLPLLGQRRPLSRMGAAQPRLLGLCHRSRSPLPRRSPLDDRGRGKPHGAFRPLPTNSPVGPRRYATLLRAGYRALKRVRRRNIVIRGMTFTYGEVLPRDFARWMRLPSGKPPPSTGTGTIRSRFGSPSCDSTHGRRPTGHGTSATWTHSTLSFVASIRVSTAASAGGGRSSGSPSSRSRRTGATTTSTTTSRGPSRPNGCRPPTGSPHRTTYVAALGWFNLMDEPPSVPWGLTTGLIDGNSRPKPAYYAYKRAP